MASRPMLKDKRGVAYSMDFKRPSPVAKRCKSSIDKTARYLKIKAHTKCTKHKTAPYLRSKVQATLSANPSTQGKQRASPLPTSPTFDECRNQVKEAIRLFDEAYMKISCDHGRKMSQLPLEVASLLRKEGKWVNTSKRIGIVPGVTIGDAFRWRAEMRVVGLHDCFNNGIDYLKTLNGKTLATSIVDSGRYANHDASPQVLMYFGEGGNPSVSSKRKLKDQRLERGNMALKNSMEEKEPVRVIRKVKTPLGNRFVYVGLYEVINLKEERALSTGKFVLKFQLERVRDQPNFSSLKLFSQRSEGKLGGEEVEEEKDEGNAHLLPATKGCLGDFIEEYSSTEGHVGDNDFPKSYAAECDDLLMHPKDYFNNHPCLIGKIDLANVSKNYDIIDGCDCLEGCSDSEDCVCKKRNGGELPYDYDECIQNSKTHIFECSRSCKCFYSCINRVTQRGPKQILEIFKTSINSYGIRSRAQISSGKFLCKFDRIKYKEVEEKIDEVAHKEPLKFAEWGYVVDGDLLENVGRFMNHSFSPNLEAKTVVFDEDGKGFNVMLFARKDIPPLEELTYDYFNAIKEMDFGGQSA